ISDDLKRAALRLKACGRDSDDKICRIADLSKSTLYRTLCRCQATGDVTKAVAIGCGRPQKLIQLDCNYLLCLACHKPTLFLDEYTHHLEEYCHLPVSLATVYQSFKQAGLSVKQVQKLALERDPLIRASFICWIGQYPANYLISLDEMSKDDRT
ncbi:hypothetical protein PAXINDRAFT_59616, partial [Paxillus involutus ATCC 200175]